MTITDHAFSTYAAVGIREDLADIISNISPTETPFTMGAGTGSVDNTLFEFQTDALATAVSTNAQLEGDDITTYDAITATVRRGNYTQIARKTAVVSGTEEKVNKAGRKSEMAYQLTKKGKELKRDVEKQLLDNIAANAGSTSVSRKTGSFLAHIKTNYDKASDGTVPVYTTIANDVWTNGTQRAFSETILKNVVQQCWTSGANVSTIMVGAANKQLTSTFSGIATRNLFQNTAKATGIIGAADIYISDFGPLDIVANRFQRARDAFFIDWDFVSIDYLRAYEQTPLAKTGDAEKRLLLVEYGLRVKNEAAHGVAVDLS